MGALLYYCTLVKHDNLIVKLTRKKPVRNVGRTFFSLERMLKAIHVQRVLKAIVLCFCRFGFRVHIVIISFFENVPLF